MTKTIDRYFNWKSIIHAGGKIAPWGCFRFNGWVRARYDFPSIQMYTVGFHPDLIAYAEQGCVLKNVEGHVGVVKRGRVISRLKPSQITHVSEETSELISKSGHLGYSDLARLEGALAKAARGEDPGEYDNSPLYKVARRHAGQKAILLRIDEMAKVFLPDGTQLWCKVYFPLSFERWGKSLPRRRLSSRISPGLVGEE